MIIFVASSVTMLGAVAFASGPGGLGGLNGLLGGLLGGSSVKSGSNSGNGGLINLPTPPISLPPVLPSNTVPCVTKCSTPQCQTNCSPDGPKPPGGPSRPSGPAPHHGGSSPSRGAGSAAGGGGGAGLPSPPSTPSATGITVQAPPAIVQLSPIAGISFGRAPFLWPLFVGLDILGLVAVALVLRRTWARPVAD